MAYWLLKTEPSEFAYEDLERLGRDRWDGVRNALALRHLSHMAPGDEAFVYHTGKVRALVGVCRVVSAPYPDPHGDDPRWLVVDVEPGYRLARPVSLQAIKLDERFAGWELVRFSRLSVMPVPEPLWRLLNELAATPLAKS